MNKYRECLEKIATFSGCCVQELLEDPCTLRELFNTVGGPGGIEIWWRFWSEIELNTPINQLIIN